jgi:signal transduction histidine kinase
LKINDVGEALESVCLPLMVLGREGRLVQTNASFRAAFCRGSDPGACSLGKIGNGVFSGSAFAHFLEEIRSRGSALSRITTGNRTFEAWGSLLSGGDEEKLLIALSNVSERPSEEARAERLNRQLGIILDILRSTTSSSSLHDTLTAVVQKTVELLDFDAGAVYLSDKKRVFADLRARYGLYTLYFPESVDLVMAAPEVLAVFHQGRPDYSETYLEVDHEEGELGVYSRAIVPVSVPDGTVLGALAIASSDFHCFTPLEQETLEAIGREVGGVIHKAALAEELAAAKAEAEFYLDVMIHDINNANNVAMGYLDLLRDCLSGEQGTLADRCMQGIRQSSGIIEEVRILRTRSGGETVLIPVSLDRVIPAVIVQMPGVAIAYEEKPAAVFADDLLGQVFVNLIGNSVKFGGPGVQITVTVREEGDEVRVCIADNGPGIPDNLKEKVFERFYRSDPSKPGRGMGLFIAAMLVKRYGGEIRAEDRVFGRPEEGAAFCVTLRKAAP